MEIIERQTLRKLASRWMELASLPLMAERKRQWTALKDLRPERPMVLFETATLESYIADEELVCRETYLREVEKQLRWNIRHTEEVGDDIVLEPYWRVYWDIQLSDYGVELQLTRAIDDQGADTGFHYNHPIRTLQDIEKLTPRSWQVDRVKTLQRVEQLQEAFGDLLPVHLHGTFGILASLTQDLFKLIGNDNLLAWTYDAPEALHSIMVYLREDRLAYYHWLESEGLLGMNTSFDTYSSPGFVSELPRPGYTGAARLRDLWIWMESQETTMISPRMFGRLFLPYMAEVARQFGLVYYGCCEPVHDRWELLIEAIPNIRAVSISPWCNLWVMGEKLGRDYVFSRKPKPWLISGNNPDWDALQQDVDETIAAARDGNLEFIFRDVYRINGDRARLRQWVEMARSRFS
jgi:hypothetical protein